MVPATLYVDGSQVKAVDRVSGLEKLVAQLARHHFILIHRFGLLGQQAPHQRVNSTCKGDPEAMLGMGAAGDIFHCWLLPLPDIFSFSGERRANCTSRAGSGERRAQCSPQGMLGAGGQSRPPAVLG